MKVDKIIRFECLVFFIGCILLYNYLQLNWIIFTVLFFTPDISIGFYLINKKIGRLAYNLVRTHIIPLSILIVNYFTLGSKTVFAICIILIAHISIDRFLGFGLKCSDDFKITHIQKI